MKSELQRLGINIDALRNCIESLAEAKKIRPTDKFAIAGVVMHFEFTYELYWKTFKRLLELEGRQIPAVSPRSVFVAA